MCHKTALQLSICFTLACGLSAQGETVAVQLGDARKIEFLDVESAAKRLSTSDVFTKTTESLERQFRLQSHEKISEQQLLTFAGEQSLAWDDKDTDSLRTIIAAIGDRIAKQQWKVPFPQKIEFVKTTGNEEGEAAYCRGNVIILSKKMLNLPQNRLKHLIAHELFHILSRHNPELRDDLFHIVGFTQCSPLQFPSELRSFRLTNPDAPTIEHFIQIDHDGETVSAMPITLLTTDRFSKGSMFSFLQFRLLLVEEPAEGEAIEALRDSNGELRFAGADNATFIRKVGKNTEYTIHPEEIMADNFAAMLLGRQQLPDPWIIDQMQRILAKERAGKTK